MATLKQKIGSRPFRMRRQRRINERRRKIAEAMRRDKDAHHSWYRRLIENSFWDDSRVVEVLIPALAMVNSPSQVPRKLEDVIKENCDGATPISFMMRAAEYYGLPASVLTEAERSSRPYRDCDESPLPIQTRSPQLQMALADRQPRFPRLRSALYWLRRLLIGRV